MIVLISIILLLFYAFIIFFAMIGWHKILKVSQSNDYQDMSYPFCSVIIAARNEEQNIENIIKSLLAQQYPHDCYEIIVVDDHSTDRTQQILHEISSTNQQLTILSSPNESCGKKQALQFGLEHAQGELLLFTDADCILNEHWIESYVNFTQKHPGNLFFGNVIPNISKKSSLLEKCFALDFIGILSVQNGLAKNGHPFSCNGANMCITKKFHTEAYETNSNFASGDDVFLLHKAKQIDQSKIFFVEDENAAVKTSTPSTIRTFIKQRCRWTSKSTGYKDFESIFIAFTVYLLCLCLFVYLLLFPWGNETIQHLFYLLFFYKMVLDTCLFLQTAKNFKALSYIVFAIPLQCFYFVYITLIPIISIFKSTEWKGREIR